MERPIREVGGCSCMEHQAAERYRGIIRELEHQIVQLKGIVRYLADDLGYGGIDGAEDSDGVCSGVVSILGRGDVLDGETFSDRQGELNFGSNVADERKRG